LIKINENEIYADSKKAEINNTSGVNLCSNCAFYKQEYFDMGNFLIPDECIHPDNIKGVYRYNGRTQVRIWDPSEKNSDMKCNLYEPKKSLISKVCIKLGLS
jgi:hypothetical protein